MRQQRFSESIGCLDCSDHPAINLAVMFGYVVRKDGYVQVANRIYEMRLYQSFLSEEELANAIGDEPERDRKRFIRDGRLDMKQVYIHFSKKYRTLGEIKKF